MNEESLLTVRRLAEADLPQALDLHKRVFGDSHAALLGDRFLTRTYRFFMVHPNAFGFVACVGPKVVGAVAGTLDPFYDRALRKFTLGAAVRAYLTQPWLIANRGLTAKALLALKLWIRPNPPGSRPAYLADGKTAGLGYTLIDPGYGHLRTTDRLLENSERHCRDQGMTYLIAGVRHENTKARFAYRKRGYQRDDSRPDQVTFYLRL